MFLKGVRSALVNAEKLEDAVLGKDIPLHLFVDTHQHDGKIRLDLDFNEETLTVIEPDSDAFQKFDVSKKDLKDIMLQAFPKVVVNAFSLNMLHIDIVSIDPQIEAIPTYKVRELLKDGFTSYIGHRDLANIVSKDLGIDIPYNRGHLTWKGDAVLIVAQYRGPRLPEGATELPQGAKIEYYLIY